MLKTAYIPFRITVTAVAFIGLSGCAWVGNVVGTGKQPPDEFVVVDKRPLVVPPDFQLRPPRPGVPSPQNIQPAAQVVKALFPDHKVPPAGSEGERAFLENFSQPDVDIRSTVGDDTETVDKGEMLTELLNTPGGERSGDGARIERTTPRSR